MFGALLTVLIFAFFAWYIQYHWRRKKLYVMAAKYDGPATLPFIGNALYFISSTEDTFENLTRFMNEHKTPVRFWLGQQLFLGVWHPQELEIIMNSPHALQKGDLYKYTEIGGGTGLLAALVPKWKRHRKIIMPMFNQRILDEFVRIFATQFDLLVELQKGMEIVHKQMCNVLYHYDFIFNLTSTSKEIRELAVNVHKFSSTVIKEKRIAYQKKISQKKQNKEESYEEDIPKRKSFLQLLIELSEEGFTDEEIRDEVNTFMIAGSDTTASMNSFTMMMLGMHPKLQDKVYEETIEVLGPDRAVEPKDLAKLQYLERCIKETMRLYPVGPLLLRAITKDMELEWYHSPFAIINLHRSEKYWPDPLKFDPDRFLPENVAKRHLYSWLPFSGLKYAMMAMKTLIATVSRRYKLSTEYKEVEDIKLKAGIMKPVDGYKLSIKFKERN